MTPSAPNTPYFLTRLPLPPYTMSAFFRNRSGCQRDLIDTTRRQQGGDVTGHFRSRIIGVESVSDYTRWGLSRKGVHSVERRRFRLRLPGLSTPLFRKELPLRPTKDRHKWCGSLRWGWLFGLSLHIHVKDFLYMRYKSRRDSCQ